MKNFIRGFMLGTALLFVGVSVVKLAIASGPIHSAPVVRTTGVIGVGSGTSLTLTQGISAVTGAFSSGLAGTATNDSAAAGQIGQQIITTVVRSAPVSVSSTVSINIASVSLTAGDWDVTASICLGGATTGTAFAVGVTATTGTLPTSDNIGVTRADTASTSTINSDSCLTVANVRVSLSGTTVYYAVVNATFSAGSGIGFGRLSARRMR